MSQKFEHLCTTANQKQRPSSACPYAGAQGASIPSRLSTAGYREPLEDNKKAHNIVQKDVYRYMKTQKNIDKHSSKLKAQEYGRCAKRSILDVNNSQYKTMTDVIIDQFQRAEIPEDQLYMIDKVVRMRGQTGRFGIDHSELLNYELHQTNKERDDHMNWLVYKNVPPSEYDLIGLPNSASASTLDNSPESEAKVSTILFKKLHPKQKEMDDGSDIGKTFPSESSYADQDTRMNYQEWLKKKDMEKRLKRKLTRQAQNQVREELLAIAKKEKTKFEERVAAMDSWLMTKKLEEAKRIASLRDVHQREEAHAALKNQSKIKSFSDWQKKQGRHKNNRVKSAKVRSNQVARNRVDQEIQRRQAHMDQQMEEQYEENYEEDPMDLQDMEMGGLEMEVMDAEMEHEQQRYAHQPLRVKGGQQY